MNKPLPYRDQRVADAHQQDVRHRYYWDHYGKPLWHLFIVFCIGYTIMHVFHISPSQDFLEDPYQFTR